ncbi:MAG: MMPL family transporter [Chloroflexi bacterium]|nr:MMPL family transporter [Chloroflexota bacterium]
MGVGGPTAMQADARDAVNRDIAVVGPVVVVLIWVILLLLLRSLVAATYLLGSVVLSFVSAVGLSVVIFQYALGHPGLGYQNVVWMFIFLAALGADYNILIISRVREEIRTRGLSGGVRAAVARTGGVVTSAGLILAGTFAVLTTFPLRDVFQLGFAVALGVLIDTFIVRALFVPSIVLLLRRWNWWPSRIGTTPVPVPVRVDESDAVTKIR